MQENFALVQQGFRVLLKSLSGYIGKEMSAHFGSRWWDEVLTVLRNPQDLPYGGEYSVLVDSLDVANCLRLIEREWYGTFENKLPLNCRTWARELMGARNDVSHIGQQDLSQEVAERYLNTMVLLCREIDSDSADEIEEVYMKVRARAADAPLSPTIYIGTEQPAPISPKYASTKDSLLKLVDSEFVQKTTQSRKVTFGGKTQIYPVYRVRLDKLYYNDQNDRISTWISQYESKNGVGSLSSLDTESYNSIIENFICESNPEALQKTKNNISLVGQREAGVVLADGRIVDGNRRYTCLRKIERESGNPQFFETVIMEMDIHDDKKQIKLLELAIQHGEEKKVDYDLIDYAIGTYRDVIQTQLLTADEYAESANEPISAVKERIDVAKIICEFLEYIRLPEQYYIARDYQVYSLFYEMMAPLKRLNETEKVQLKHIAFINVLMNAVADQRKFIRDIKKLIRNGTYAEYFSNQQMLEQQILSLYSSVEIHEKKDIESFALSNHKLAEDLQLSMERAMQLSRSQQLRNKPSDNVAKCVDLLMEVDPRLFNRLDNDDKENLKVSLAELSKIIGTFQKKLVE